MPQTLPPQPWMSHPSVIAVMDALEAQAGRDGARFVGGCVRNALLGAPVGDIDVATVLEPPEVKAALAAARIAALPTGEEHGVITALAQGRAIEIATLRRDVETDGRRAVVAFTRDWAEDAARRDFRINALYADRAGLLFDPTGHGLADARERRIVFVGEAEPRIREDALRILRFFRFFAWYGAGEPDAAGLAACASLRELLARLSAERVAKELLALLAAPDPREALRLMDEAGVLALAAPEATNLARLNALVTIEDELLAPPDALLRLAALLPDDPDAALALAARLKLSNAQKDRLAEAARADARIVSWMSPRQVRQALWRLGPDALADKVKLAWTGGAGSALQWRALLPIAQTWPRPRFPLSGEQVVAAGVPQGPLVGRVLAEVEAWWVDADFPTDELSVIERLKAVVQGLARG